MRPENLHSIPSAVQLPFEGCRQNKSNAPMPREPKGSLGIVTLVVLTIGTSICLYYKPSRIGADDILHFLMSAF